MATTKAYKVNFKIGGAYNTNIVYAEREAQVHEEYAGYDCVSISVAAYHEVEALRGRGCPEIVCKHEPTAEDIEFTSELTHILSDRADAELNLADAVTKLERQYWSGAVDAYDLVIRTLTGFPIDEVRAELKRRNGYMVF